MGSPQFIPWLWGLSWALLECSKFSPAETPSLRLLPLPQPQIIGPIHLGAGNLHTAQEVMDDSSKPVCLRLAQLSISVGCEAHLSFCLLAGGRPVCALHPGSSKAPLQATCGCLGSLQSSRLLWCSWSYLPLDPWTCHTWCCCKAALLTGLQQRCFEYLFCTRHLQVLKCRPSQSAEAYPRAPSLSSEQQH